MPQVAGQAGGIAPSTLYQPRDQTVLEPQFEEPPTRNLRAAPPPVPGQAVAVHLQSPDPVLVAVAPADPWIPDWGTQRGRRPLPGCWPSSPERRSARGPVHSAVADHVRFEFLVG
ncbi:hypothetical protein GCM10023166_19360 [Paeniglutamicibacter cryotolerans]